MGHGIYDPFSVGAAGNAEPVSLGWKAMFFTDSSWKATTRLAGGLREPFDRWRMIGLAGTTPTFIVSHSASVLGEGDASALLVADTELLLNLLKQPWPGTPSVYALCGDQITPIQELWAYCIASKLRMRYFAYRGPNGELVPCALGQPDLSCAASCERVWALPQG